jgi:hypothetical protein
MAKLHKHQKSVRNMMKLQRNAKRRAFVADCMKAGATSEQMSELWLSQHGEKLSSGLFRQIRCQLREEWAEDADVSELLGKTLRAAAEMLGTDRRDLVQWDAEGNVTLTPSDSITQSDANMVRRLTKDGNKTTIMFESYPAVMSTLARLAGAYKSDQDAQNVIEYLTGVGTQAAINALKMITDGTSATGALISYCKSISAASTANQETWTTEGKDGN